jgi:hypothetical protein
MFNELKLGIVSWGERLATSFQSLIISSGSTTHLSSLDNIPIEILNLILAKLSLQ